MANQPKYLFDLSFDHPQGPVAVRFPRNTPEPTFTRAELEAARAAARQEGRQSGVSEASASAEGRLADATDALASGFASLLARADEIPRETEAHALELLRMVAAKAVPALARKEPLAELEAMVID